ncbi:hypothetical protein BJD20_05020 [Acinetobacter proteolyticus]|uniref:FkbM family methyltransferase n=1 Tax=Acinetobacter proteolyticus TaxID=1776741 RepID=UPI00086335AF|nr:FkbM family methyltransferase [Acinetobacter proteolyticus]OEY93524.1 hypothetical protein BJD20_05020 [Acinetobacter proteolyticus]
MDYVAKIILSILGFLYKIFFWIPFFNKRTYFRSAFFSTLPQDKLAISIIGTEQFIHSPKDKHIGRSVFIRGHFDFDKFEKTMDILKEHEFKFHTLIDIGANIGTICIPAINRNFFHKAIAIEPEPLNYRLLSINILLNKLGDRIQSYNLALSDKAGDSVDFGLSIDNYGDHRVKRSENQDENREVIKVYTETLTTYIKDLETDQTLIWMDTQGYETFILKGAKEIIENNAPKLVLEFDPKHFLMTDSYNEFKEILKNSSYKYIYDIETKIKYNFSISIIDDLFKLYQSKEKFTDLLFI